jgi:hypothetical protein
MYNVQYRWAGEWKFGVEDIASMDDALTVAQVYADLGFCARVTDQAGELVF